MAASQPDTGETIAVARNRWNVRRVASLYARIALGAAFLSAVASRFGLWSGTPARESFLRFIHRTGELNAFMPSFAIPFLAWAATAAEVFLGVALIVGLWRKPVGLASALFASRVRDIDDHRRWGQV